MKKMDKQSLSLVKKRSRAVARPKTPSWPSYPYKPLTCVCRLPIIGTQIISVNTY